MKDWFRRNVNPYAWWVTATISALVLVLLIWD